MGKKRRLKEGERRIRVGFTKFRTTIIKPKNYSKWKEDKFYSKSGKIWIPNREYQFSKGRYKKYKGLGIKGELVVKKAFVRKAAVKKRYPSKLKPIEPVKRFRKQVVLNYRSHDEPYAVSIRAITINPVISERGLLIAVQETKAELSINFDSFTARYLGFEETEIPPSEDVRLNDFRVHVEVLIRKEKPINFIK